MAEATPKQTADFSDEIKVKIPEYVDAAKKDSSLLKQTLENLLSLEKKTRLAADASSTRTTVLAIFDIIAHCKQWKVLNDHITLLARRRAQLKPVILAIVQQGVKYIETTTDSSLKIALIDSLRDVSEGKIYVELERARLTKMLSEIREAQGKINEAADLLSEVQIEIMGTMDKKEKATFLLEQIRLTMEKGDYIRVEILANKVNTKLLQKDADFQELKLKFYRLMVQYWTHSHNYIEICKAYRAIYDTKLIKDNREQWQKTLRLIVVYMLLAEQNEEQEAIVAQVYADENLDDLEVEKAAVHLIRTPELINRLETQEQAWRIDFFEGEDGAKRFDTLKKRVIQHNIRIISKYYSELRFERLASLLQLDINRAEELLSELVSSGAIYAKINRPAGVISFCATQHSNLILNDWSKDISKLLSLVELACHRIDKEVMMAHAKSAA